MSYLDQAPDLRTGAEALSGAVYAPYGKERDSRDWEAYFAHREGGTDLVLALDGTWTATAYTDATRSAIAAQSVGAASREAALFGVLNVLEPNTYSFLEVPKP